MKKITGILIAATLCLVLPNYANAAKWRVNNNPAAAPHFTEVHAAVNSASVAIGDTVYVEGSANNYSNVNLSKRLVIIGAGYFLGENDSTQANVNASKIGHFTFSPGSKGSQMMGISVMGYTTVNDSSIVLKRCYFNNSVNLDHVANVVFIQNMLTVDGTITVSNFSNNILISNNLFLSNYTWTNCISVVNGSAVVTNNVFAGNQNYTNCTVRNNIALGTAAAGTANATFANSTYDHNIGASTQYGTSNGNQQNVDMSAVFVNSGSTDGRYKLKAGSPAIGAGNGGVDCGIFGGNYPYVLSGLPEVPAIWYLNVNGSTVTVKAKGH